MLFANKKLPHGSPTDARIEQSKTYGHGCVLPDSEVPRMVRDERQICQRHNARSRRPVEVRLGCGAEKEGDHGQHSAECGKGEDVSICRFARHGTGENGARGCRQSVHADQNSARQSLMVDCTQNLAGHEHYL